MLTPRELQVLEFLAEGRSSKEIANFLAISEATVKGHLKNLYDKLGASDRAHAVGHRVASAHHRLNQRPVKPSISLVIPAYNEEVLLPRLLRSIRTACDVFAAWSGGSVEVIVADNASPDRTAEVATEFGSPSGRSGTQGHRGGAKRRGASCFGVDYCVRRCRSADPPKYLRSDSGRDEQRSVPRRSDRVAI